MSTQPFVLIVTLFVVTLTYHPAAAQVVVPTSHDSSATIFHYNDDDQPLDTLVVTIPGRRDRTVMVNKYVEVVDGVAVPMRKVYLIGYWSYQVTQGPPGLRATYDAGIWTRYAQVPRSAHLILHDREGRVTDITPSKTK